MLTLAPLSLIKTQTKGRPSTKEERSRLDKLIVKLRIPYPIFGKLSDRIVGVDDYRKMNGSQVLRMIKYLQDNRIELQKRGMR